MKRISIYRRISQTVFFALIVYGGFVATAPLDHGRSEIIDESGYSGKYEVGRGVRFVEREKVRVNAYLPATSCYYQHRGLFSGCSLAFVSEHLTFLTPLMQILPQLLLLLVLMFLVGRLFCGWVCPFGFLGDIMTSLRQLVGLDRIDLSRRMRGVLIWVKYGLLLGAIVLSVVAMMPSLGHLKNDLLLSFCQVCLGKFASPILSGGAVCWTNFNNGVSSVLTILGLAALGVFFLGFFVRRIYCRICPIGGITAPFNRYGLIALYKKAQSCTNCGACARVCAVDNLTVLDSNVDGPVTACECTLCLRCVEVCPEQDCIELTLMGRRVTSSSATINE